MKLQEKLTCFANHAGSTHVHRKLSVIIGEAQSEHFVHPGEGVSC